MHTLAENFLSFAYIRVSKIHNINDSKMIDGISNAARIMVSPLAMLAIRVYLALIFFQAGLSKTENWSSTMTKFQTDWLIPFLSPTVSAWMATAGELVFSIMLIIGFQTRFAAFGLFIIVLVIEFIIFNGASGEREHYYWLLLLASVIGFGAEKLSIDAFFSRKSSRRFG